MYLKTHSKLFVSFQATIYYTHSQNREELLYAQVIFSWLSFRFRICAPQMLYTSRWCALLMQILPWTKRKGYGSNDLTDQREGLCRTPEKLLNCPHISSLKMHLKIFFRKTTLTNWEILDIFSETLTICFQKEMTLWTLLREWARTVKSNTH